MTAPPISASPARHAGTHRRGHARAAPVTRSTPRRILLAEVPPQEHASTLVAPGVLGHHGEPALALVTELPELRDERRGACAKALERLRDADPAFLVTLDEAG
jgi:hypothetical protein